MVKYNKMLRTDLAIEFSKNISTEYSDDLIKKSVVKVGKDLSKKINKPVGTYITVETNAVKNFDKSDYKKVSAQIASSLDKLTDCNNCLIVGLGNPNMTADSLGKKALEKIMVTRHLESGKNIPIVSAIAPNVLGVTGIESFDIISGVVSKVKPNCVIVIDSLAGASVGRIASAFQITDSGITPGSGVSNHRIRLDKTSLGVAVYSIGVPLVVYASTIINDAFNDNLPNYDTHNKEIFDMIVTPKDIDILVDDCAKIIASAINIKFYGDDIII